MWVSISIINMLFVAATRVAQKRFVTISNMNAFRLNWVMFGAGLPLMLAIITIQWHDITHLSRAFWLNLFVVVVVYYPAVSFLFIRVIRQNELSAVLPLQSLVPVFTVAFGWMLLGQDPSWIAFGGILAVTASMYVLFRRPHLPWYKPLTDLGSSGAARAMLVVSLITAAASIGDKFGIEHSSVSVYLALNVTGAVIVLIVCDFIAVHRHLVRPLRAEFSVLPAKQWLLLGMLGILQTLSIIFSFIAVHVSTNTGYTLAIRNLNVVAASLTAVILFKEHFNRYKAYSYALSAAGVILLAL